MSLTSEFPQMEIDPKAETLHDLLKDWPLRENSLRHFINRKVKAGEWERVYKKEGTRLVPAYRRKKK